MSTALNIQPAAKQQKTALIVTLWTLQVLVALLFLFAGVMKLVAPIEMLTMPGLALPGLLIRFIGVCETLGALGLLLPGIFRIQKRLTPLAAYGLIIIMIGAVVCTLIIGGGAGALMPLIVGLILAFIAYGRRSYFAA